MRKQNIRISDASCPMSGVEVSKVVQKLLTGRSREVPKAEPLLLHIGRNQTR